MKTQSNHQKVRAAVMRLTPDNMGAGNGMNIKLPQGTVLLAIAVLTTIAFNSETTATATVKDAGATLANAVDIKSAGAETVAGAPKLYAAGAVIEASLAQTGAAATAGEVVVIVQYVTLGGVDDIYG